MVQKRAVVQKVRKGIGFKEAGVVKLLSNNSHLLHLPAPKFLHNPPSQDKICVCNLFESLGFYIYSLILQEHT